MKIIAMAAVAACVGISLWLTDHLSRDASTPPPVATRSATENVTATPAAEVPEAFRPAPADARGTPGEAVAHHLAKGTPEAGLDAFRLISSCQLSRVARACNGITPAMEQQAVERVTTAMAAGVHGAAVAFYAMMRHVPPEAFKELETNAGLRQGVATMVDALKLAVREAHDRSAISALSVLYSGATPMMSECNCKEG